MALQNVVGNSVKESEHNVSELGFFSHLFVCKRWTWRHARICFATAGGGYRTRPHISKSSDLKALTYQSFAQEHAFVPTCAEGDDLRFARGMVADIRDRLSETQRPVSCETPII